MPPGTPRPHDGLRAYRRLGLWAGVLLMLTACARDAVIESVDPDVGGHLLEPGGSRDLGQKSEVLRAEIELLGLALASMESHRCPALDDRPASIETRVDAAPLVRAIRRTSGEARTVFGGETAAPTRSDYVMRDGSLLRHYLVDHAEGRFDYSYDNGGAHSRRGHDDVPEGAAAHDLHSAMVLLRAWRPRLDETAYFYVVMGRRLWRVDVAAKGPQVIKIDGVPQLTYRIDGVGVRAWQPTEVEPRHFSLWVSEDPERVPLRMVADASFGEVTMTLTDRKVGAARCAADTGSDSSTEAPPAATTGVVGSSWRTPRPSAETPAAE